MGFSLKACVAVLASLTLAGCSPFQPGLVERQVCNEDNLLRALQNPTRTADSYPFCSSYISQPATTTVTVYTSVYTEALTSTYYSTIYPLDLYNLPRYSDNPDIPITYTAKTASSVPGDPQTYGYPWDKRDVPAPTPTPRAEERQLEERQQGVLSFLATYPPSRISSGCSCLSVPYRATVTQSTYSYTEATVATCTEFITGPTLTYPAYCAPSLQKNAPAPSARPSVVVGPIFPVGSKMDCCLACTQIFNCVWWKFDWGDAAKDPWAPGTCHYAWHTDNVGVDGNTPLICPNGPVRSPGILPAGGYYDTSNLYGSGYNEGACGNALQLFESDRTQGLPSDYYQLKICPY